MGRGYWCCCWFDRERKRLFFLLLISACFIVCHASAQIRINEIMTENGEFTVYGKAEPYTSVKATVNMTVEMGESSIGRFELVASAVAEALQTVQRTVGQTISDAQGNYVMDVRLPEPGEYIVEFTAGGSYARYGVTFSGAAEPCLCPRRCRRLPRWRRRADFPSCPSSSPAC